MCILLYYYLGLLTRQAYTQKRPKALLKLWSSSSSLLLESGNFPFHAHMFGTKTFHTQFVIMLKIVKSNNLLLQATSENGGWITSSELSVRVHPNDRNKMISCYAVNQELGETIQKSHMVSILCKSIFLYWYKVR